MDIKNSAPLIQGRHIQREPVVNTVVLPEKMQNSFFVKKSEDLLLRSLNESVGSSEFVGKFGRAKKEEVEKAIAKITEVFQAEQRSLSFSVNKVTNDMVIEVRDTETDELIRRIPPEFVVKLAEHLLEMVSDSNNTSGYLMKDRA